MHTIKKSKARTGRTFNISSSQAQTNFYNQNTSHTPSDPTLFRSHCTKSCEPSLLTRKKKTQHEPWALLPRNPSFLSLSLSPSLAWVTRLQNQRSITNYANFTVQKKSNSYLHRIYVLWYCRKFWNSSCSDTALEIAQELLPSLHR